MATAVVTMDDMVALASTGAGYCPQDAYVVVMLDGRDQLAGIAAVPGQAPAEDLVALVLDEPLMRQRGAARALLFAFGHTVSDLSDPQVIDLLMGIGTVLLIAQVREGTYRVTGTAPGFAMPVQPGWQPVQISDVSLAMPTPAATRDDLRNTVTPGHHQLPTDPTGLLDTTEHRRLVEEAALALATSPIDPADLPDTTRILWLACQHPHVRDPLIHRLTAAPLPQRDQALANLVTTVGYLQPDPELYATLALLQWLNGCSVLALECAERAQHLHPRTALAHLVHTAVTAGLPPTTWTTATANLTPDTMRRT